ncbi:MAG: FtsX-like permease family protein [Bacilli bacterium]
MSTNHLVLIVTHDKFLSKKYSNYEITLKDGQIIHNTLENINHSNKEELDKRTNLNLNPIQPSFKTPILLSLKSLKQNLIRFIFIIVFFCISLIFANTTINLYFSNATAQYSRFQTEYNNKYITLSRQQTLYNQTVKTGFFQIDTINYENLIRSFNQDNGETESNNNYQYKIYKTFKNPIAINQNLEGNLDFIHSESIDNIIVIEDLTEFEKDYTIIPVYNTLPNSQMPIRCYITDYVAESLIANNYFNDTVDENWSNYFADKTIQSENLNNKIYIEGIIETNFNDFIDADLDDPNTFASFTDNKAFYNSLFFNSSIYVSAENANQFVSTNNIQYTYDDFIYSALNQNGIFNNIKLTSYGNTLSVIKGKKPEKKTSDDDFEQIAISTGLLEKVFHYTADEIQFDEDGSMDYALLNPETNTAATFTFYGYRRVMANFSCQVVGIIENGNPVIYFCNPNETNMYYNYLKTSFSDYDNSSKNFGGSLTVLISDSEESNISLYQALRENNITIDNLSYIKLQVVNQFINENLILFLGLFFALCVFSILMIFNFVVITIKNSTKDIGIYMSLGMNGFKISFIYLFQIIIVSTISFILSLIGAIIFLNLLDINLSTTASNLINQYYNLDILPIDFQTFKITTSGILISLLIAYIVPILSVIIPLINLSRKRPIDVLKVS